MSRMANLTFVSTKVPTEGEDEDPQQERTLAAETALPEQELQTG